MVRFSVLGPAVPKGRPVFGKGVARTPAKTKRYEEVVQAAAICAMGNTPPLHGAVVLIVREYRAMPTSWSLARRARAAAGGERPISKPDADNVAKVVMDSLNEICYLDDAQICRLVAEKLYDHDPRVEVEVLPCP